MTKWLSNKKNVLQGIKETERAKSLVALDLDLEDLPTQRTLGVLWDVNKDKFTFKTSLKLKPRTRRGILSVSSSIYDPLGFIAPVVLPAKKLLQDLTRRKLKWDEEIEEEDVLIWENWLQDIPNLMNVTIERSIIPEHFGDLQLIQLHHFADASEMSYGAVSYSRVVDVNNNVHCAFLFGKGRLAPIKTISIPRLELSAAALSVKFDDMLREELDMPVHESIFWTDSTTVIGYIKNTTSRFHTFVANRLAIIHDGSQPNQWRYIPTSLNPADSVTRGLTAKELCNEENQWLNGPQFLQKDENSWPSLQYQPVDETLLETKKVRQTFLISTPNQDSGLDKVISYHSSWYKLKKSVAWIIRFYKSLKAKEQVPKASLSPSEIKSAETKIIKHVQRQNFGEAIESLEVPERIDVKPRKSQRRIMGPIYKLNPVLDDNGMLRVGGRLTKAPIEFDAKHPLILPGHHHVTHLIIRECHETIGHSGQNFVHSIVREKYWIVKGKSSVRKVIQDCMKCKKRDAKRGEQIMADLPEDRLTPDKPPFTYVGVDYFGPLYVRQGRSQVKRYGCVFTCLTIRAVHIEIAHSLDTSSFLNALRRFISRRGTPEMIRSDNGTNFVGGERELREALETWNQQKINNDLCQKGISWKFNPPLSSHMGGVWERQIRTIRRILKVLLDEQMVTDEALTTLMAEVESIVNSRPITPLSNDPNDLEPLTPNHLLLLRRSPQCLPPGTFNKDDSFSRRRWRQVQYLANVFWRRWSKEYLPLLQNRCKWNQSSRNFAVDDLVLVEEVNLPRGQWQLGRIVQVYPDGKGFVRSVDVKTKDSKLTRPITKLCLLEGDQ